MLTITEAAQRYHTTPQTVVKLLGVATSDDTRAFWALSKADQALYWDMYIALTTLLGEPPHGPGPIGDDGR